MERPCVRVRRDAGEATRRTLEEAGVRDDRFRIDSDGEAVYIPVVDGYADTSEHAVVHRDVQRREGHTLPADLLDFTPTYERLGDLALLKEDDPERAAAAAGAIMDSDLPVEGVLHRRSKVKGTERVADWAVLAGDHTETVHREFGASFCVDPTVAYFSPRLATERQRVIQQLEAGEQVIDMFAGVGPFAIRAAMAGASVVAVDVNPDAVALLEANVERNDVADHVTVIEGDVRDVLDGYHRWADRLYMNLPHSAAAFLPTAAELAGERCRVHYYDIADAEDPFAAGEAAIREAFGPAISVSVAGSRIVRSYAPGQVNVCLDVDVERDA